jgi:hypothetical protein
VEVRLLHMIDYVISNRKGQDYPSKAKGTALTNAIVTQVWLFAAFSNLSGLDFHTSTYLILRTK